MGKVSRKHQGAIQSQPQTVKSKKAQPALETEVKKTTRVVANKLKKEIQNRIEARKEHEITTKPKKSLVARVKEALKSTFLVQK